MPLSPAVAQALLDRPAAQHGEPVGRMALTRSLGYRTPRAFQIAVRRDQFPATTFPLAGRRGSFARMFELMRWIATCDFPHALEERP